MSARALSADNSFESNEARKKLLQIFRFLQALHHLRNPVQREIQAQPWVMWWRDLPDHPCVRRGRVAPPSHGGGADSPQDDAGAEGDPFILKVRRPTLTPAPEPPTEIAEWLEAGWDEVNGSAKVLSQKNESLPNGTTRVVRFQDDQRRVVSMERWVSLRNRWAETERPARQALSIFDRLYSLHAQLQREGESFELMLGDGLLVWRRPEGIVRHPVLLQRLYLEFDPLVPEFTLSDALQPPELYSALFRAMPDVNPTAIGHARTELEAAGWHPLGGDETDSFLKRLVMRMSARGEFCGNGEPRADGSVPRIGRSPMVFLRRRTLGFGAALEAILKDLSTREDLPSALLRIVGIDAEQGRVKDIEEEPSWYTSPNGEDEQILFTKPANREQLEIGRRLDRHGAVLVQGPPGTGKTHTIGNLIGHLLAEGKSVLVTSHTTKALKVLRDQVVEPLRPLCVSVLDESTRLLENSIEMITDRLSSVNPEQLEREGARLQESRLRILSELRNARTALGQARQDEYRPIVHSGEEYPPSEAARWVAERESSAGWIPGPVTADEPLPLSSGELVELYSSNVMVTPEDEDDLVGVLPEVNEIITPTDFRAMVKDMANLEAVGSLEYRVDLWTKPVSPDNGEALIDILNGLKQGFESFADAPKWWLAAAQAGWEGGAARQVWEDLISEIEAVYQQAAAAQVLLLKYGPELPEDCLPGKAPAVLDAIISHLKNSGKLNWLTLVTRGDWKIILGNARVGGRQPETVEHFEALRTLVQLRAARGALLSRWQRQMTPLGAPVPNELGPEPERTCRQFTPQIRRAMDLYAGTWSRLHDDLVRQGLRWENFFAGVAPYTEEFGDLLRLRWAATEGLPPVVMAEGNRRRWQWWQDRVSDTERRLDLAATEYGRRHFATAPVVQRLRDAIRAKDPDAYGSAFERLVDLHGRRRALARRRQLLTRLEQVAPAWAEQVRRREGIHGRGDLPGDPSEAWKWRQLHDELVRRSEKSIEGLQSRINRLTEELWQVTGELVERRTWAAQVRRTTLTQRQALVGWQKIMTRIGKGTGKRVPQLQAEARRLMPVCQTSVPVWIMPLNRVVETYDPSRTRFDVVIIDEASQADLNALVAAYMAKQVVVVGDHEQVSPLAVGQVLDEVQRLIEEHLSGIPNAVLYDGRFSIYELAQTAFEPICLREHFRCVRPIIEFSNDLSYQGKIKPLRDASSVRRKPHTIAYRVESATADGKVNDEEAITIASLLVAATEEPEYDGATFGVISLIGDEQARRIDSLCQRYLSPDEYHRRRVLCGNSAHFQGDERDVMFLSMVATSSGSGPLPLLREGSENMFKKRFNVAASRARDQLWVVYSLDPATDIQPGDLRRRLIEHVKDPYAVLRAVETAEARAESEFERQVLQRLIRGGYRAIPQWTVGAYRIDIVVEGGGKRLAIECDGDRWHPPEKLTEDMERQAVLERLGWRFVRLRGSEYFRNPDQAMARVFARLESLGILPEGNGDSSQTPDGDSELLERIKRRAAELRQSWIERGEVQWAQRTRAPRSVVSAGQTTLPLNQLKKSQTTEPRVDLAESTHNVAMPVSPHVSGPRAALGYTVVVRDRATKEDSTFVLTKPHQGNPADGRISTESPVGRALLGRRAGEVVKIPVPGGILEYELLAVLQP